MKEVTHLKRTNRQVALSKRDAQALSFYNNVFVKIFIQPAREGYYPLQRFYEQGFWEVSQ